MPSILRLRPLVLLAATSCLGLAFVPALRGNPGASAQESDMKVSRLMKTCERCHLDVWPEWQASGHAAAWTNPEFQAAIVDREDGGAACARCHASDSMLRIEPGSLPLARSTDRELGVNCITCHMNERLYYGPLPSAAHGEVQVSDEYRKSAWCGSCHGHPEGLPHGEHYTGWLASPAKADGQSCQSCHMPPIERPLAVAKRPLKDLQPPQQVRVHLFGVERDDDGVMVGAATFTAVFGAGTLVVTVLPHGGHALAVHPEDRVRLVVTLFDAAGNQLAMFRPLEKVFAVAGDDALAPGQPFEVRFEVPDAAAARLELQRVERESGKLVERLATAKVSRGE